MIKKVITVAALSLCLSIASWVATTPVFAGNGSSRPAPPIQELTLDQALTQFGGLMSQSRQSIMQQYPEGKDTSIPGVSALLHIYTYELTQDGSNIAFKSKDENATPIGVVCRNAGLQQYTMESVKSLLGEPQSEKASDDGRMVLEYDAVQGSAYLPYHLSLKFEGDRLLRFAFELKDFELDLRKS